MCTDKVINSIETTRCYSVRVGVVEEKTREKKYWWKWRWKSKRKQLKTNLWGYYRRMSVDGRSILWKKTWIKMNRCIKDLCVFKEWKPMAWMKILSEGWFSNYYILVTSPWGEAVPVIILKQIINLKTQKWWR